MLKKLIFLSLLFFVSVEASEHISDETSPTTLYKVVQPLLPGMRISDADFQSFLSENRYQFKEQMEVTSISGSKVLKGTLSQGEVALGAAYLRLVPQGSILNIDHEVAHQKLAATNGLAPSVHRHTPKGAILMEAIDVDHEPMNIMTFAPVLRKFHQIDLASSNDNSPIDIFSRIDGVVVYLDDTYKAWKEKFADQNKRVMDLLERHKAQILHACHGDLHPGNILKTTTGRYVLIDYTYAGPRDRLQDLGMLLSLQDSSPQEEAQFLAAYLQGETLSEIERAKLVLLKQVALQYYGASFWAVAMYHGNPDAPLTEDALTSFRRWGPLAEKALEMTNPQKDSGHKIYTAFAKVLLNKALQAMNSPEYMQAIAFLDTAQ